MRSSRARLHARATPLSHLSRAPPRAPAAPMSRVCAHHARAAIARTRTRTPPAPLPPPPPAVLRLRLDRRLDVQLHGRHAAADGRRHAAVQPAHVPRAGGPRDLARSRGARR
eukprot:6524665-Prymnesium_polylepis.1